MSTVLRPGDVLRGMHLESQAFCVGRTRVPGDAVPASPVATAIATVDVMQERVEAEVERLRAAAEKDGYEAGLRQGHAAAARQAESERQQASAQAHAVLEEERKAVRALAANVAATARDLLNCAEDDMVTLCFDVLCRVLGESVPPHQAIRAQLRSAARHLPPAGDIAVHVHPVDADLLAGCAETEPGRFQWVADADVALGGCVVKHAGGGLDLRFETALAACREALSAERERRRLARGPS